MHADLIREKSLNSNFYYISTLYRISNFWTTRRRPPMKNTFASVLHNTLDFLYPPICLRCKTIMSPDFKILCQPCFESLQLLSPFRRCRRCFHALDEGGHRCPRSALTSRASCFEDSLSSRTLLSTPGTAVAPFVLMQWHELQWPLPDLVVPTPGDWFSRGNDRWKARKEIALNVAHLLNRPYASCLGMHRHLLPLPYLSLEEQRQDVDSHALTIRTPDIVINANILLIHDTSTSGLALHASAKTLINSGALNVWGISVVSS
jgi:competence protein ComFC